MECNQLYYFRDAFDKVYSKQINTRKRYRVEIYSYEKEERYLNKEYWFQSLKNIEDCCNAHYLRPWAWEFNLPHGLSYSSYGEDSSFELSIFDKEGHRETRYYE